MSRIRLPAVAGTFYPAESENLRSAVSDMLGGARADGPVPKALIGPHAGYVYSGPIAASAYARLVSARGVVRRVVLLGPAHYVPFEGVAASSAEWFATPLGPIRVDREGVEEALSLPGVRLLDEAHAPEHSLETHLPFLQATLGEFTLVPLVVGEAAPETVCRVIERLWGGPETLFAVSTDLSHFLPYDAAREIDSATCRAVETLCPEEIGRDQACGYIPLNGLLMAARVRALRVETLDLRNSGDTAGPRYQVVGYGAWALSDSEAI